MKPKTIKIIDKVVAWTKRVKDPVVYANKKVKDTNDYQQINWIMEKNKKMTI